MNTGQILTEAEAKELVHLGHRIVQSLQCDANGTGLPCRTDRLTAVMLMVRYLELAIPHDHQVTDTREMP